MESEKIVICAQIENDKLEERKRELEREIEEVEREIETNKKLIEKYCKHKYKNNKCIYCNNLFTTDATHNQDHKLRKNNQTVS